MMSTTISGLGIYSTQDAARFSGLHPSRVRRWVQGYGYVMKDGSRRQAAPVLRREQGVKADLSFADLIEILFVGALLKHGVKMPAIRRAAGEAQQLFGEPRPFSLKRLETDGESVFARLGGTSHRRAPVLDLVRKQHVFGDVVEPYFKLLDYENDVAARWWPLGKKSGIVVDPRRSFGQPVVADCGIPTRVLFNAVQAGQTQAVVADWFNVTPADVRVAVRFEKMKM